jgi:hypothetical protein
VWIPYRVRSTGYLALGLCNFVLFPHQMPPQMLHVSPNGISHCGMAVTLKPWPSAFEVVLSLCQALLCHETRLGGGPSGASGPSGLSIRYLFTPSSILYTVYPPNLSSFFYVVCYLAVSLNSIQQSRHIVTSQAFSSQIASSTGTETHRIGINHPRPEHSFWITTVAVHNYYETYETI